MLNTGMSALLAFQRSIATTSHNIANVNTEGYSRQRTELAPRLAEAYGNGFVGTGVDVQTVRRVYDEFLALQMRDSGGEFARLDSFSTLAGRLDNLLANPQAGLAPALQNFFAAVQNVADSPTSATARQMLLSEAQAVADRAGTIAGQLDSLEQEVNVRLQGSVAEINSLAESIAKLNHDIVLAGQAMGQPPNDLMDQRDQLINRLSEEVGIMVATQEDGSKNIFIGNGQNLVVGNTAQQLKVVASEFSPERLEIMYAGDAGGANVTSMISGGKLGGALEFRTQMLDPARSQLGGVVTGLAMAFNEQHRAGMDLNGQLGGDFFTLAQVPVNVSAANAGSAAVSATINDPGALEMTDYRMRFDGSAWSLQRMDTGEQVALTGAGTAADPFVADGLSIVVGAGAAAGDRFMIRPTSETSLGLAISNTDLIAAAAPIRALADRNNLGDATISPGVVMDAADPALLGSVVIEFTGPNTYSVNGAGAFAWSDGDAIAINGWQVQIDGAPAVGDRFTVQANIGGGGDNRNMLLLDDVQGLKVLDGGTTSINAAYGQLVADVGVKTRQANVGRDAMESMHNQAVQDMMSVSGVNLDEEAANLMKMQQAYAAAARVISTADEMFMTLLGMVR